MKVTQKVKVDMERREYPAHIDVVQMDANSRVLEISLFSGGVPWNVPSDASVSLAFKKADGHGGWYDTLPNGENAFVVDGNVVNATLAPEVATFAGRVDLSLVMQNPETLDQIASFPMVLMVAENPANGQQLSNDYFNYKTMTEVNKAIDAFAKQIGSFDGSLRPIDFTLTATNAANNNWSSIRDLPTNRIYRLPYNDHPVDFGMPYSGSKQSLLAVIGTGNINWYTLYICADRDGTIWISYVDPTSSDDVKWISIGDDPVDVQKHLYDLAKRGQTVARFRGTHIVKKKIKIPASMTVIGGEFIADPSFEDAIFSAGGDGCRLVNVTMKAPALDKTPKIFVENGVATEAKDSNVTGLYSSNHNGLALIDCHMDKIAPMRINGGSIEVRGCRITDCSMFVWATDCDVVAADNEVHICNTGLDYYYHVYYVNKNSQLFSSNNHIWCETNVPFWDVYHLMTAGNDGAYRASATVDGDVIFGNFQHIVDSHYADIVLKNCKIHNSNTEKWSEFQNWGHIKCRFEGCDLDYTGSVMSSEDLSEYPDAEIVYDCCKIMLDDSLNRNRCYLRSDIVQRLDGVPALRDNSDVISCSFSILGSGNGSPVGFVDENKYSTSSMHGDASVVGANGFSGKIIGNVVEFVDSPTNEELFVFKKFSGAVANNTFFGTNKGVISGSEYDGVFNNYIDGVGVFGNVDEQEVQRIVVEYLKDHPSAGGDVFVDDSLTVSGAAADAAVVGSQLTTIKEYMYSQEKVAKFVTTSSAILTVDTDRKQVKVHSGLLYYRGERTNIPETIVSIDQTSALSYTVWDAIDKAVKSIDPATFDGTRMFLIGILSRDYPTNTNYNYVPGPYDVNGYLYNAPVSQPVYVSTDGSDAWNAIGDRIHPFRTIGKAIASGAKTIIVFAGTYREPVSLSRTGDEFELLCKPVYQSDGTVLDKVVIDLSAQLDMVADSTTGLVKAAYASTEEDFIHKVFVGRTEALVCDDTFIEKGYTCNLWRGNTKLRPVLSLEECQATTWTWFYDGANVYANAAPGAYSLNDGAVDYGVSLSYFRKVKLLGIEVRHAKTDGVKLLNCSDAEITGCVFGYSGVRTGLALENTSAIVRGCEAMFNRTDGLNIHGTGVADFIDCRSHDNGDDGISHHDKSSGTVIGGEYYNNGKGGVCSPTFGSRNGVNGAEIHHNGVGVYAVADSNVASYPDSSVSNCVIRDNGVGIKTQYYKLKCWGNVLEGNDTDVVEEYGGIVEIVRDSIPSPTTAQVGQTIVVKEVDGYGKPVSWECADVAGGGKLELISETEITTEDEVALIEFDGLESYDEAMLVVYCPWNGNLSATLTAVTQINGNQVEKDWYEFQNKTQSKYNVLRIKRIDDKYYDVLAYANSNSTRYSGSTKMRAIHKGTISKIGFSLSGAMMSLVYNGATTNCVISCYAR